MLRFPTYHLPLISQPKALESALGDQYPDTLPVSGSPSQHSNHPSRNCHCRFGLNLCLGLSQFVEISVLSLTDSVDFLSICPPTSIRATSLRVSLEGQSSDNFLTYL